LQLRIHRTFPTFTAAFLYFTPPAVTLYITWFGYGYVCYVLHTLPLPRSCLLLLGCVPAPLFTRFTTFGLLVCGSAFLPLVLVLCLRCRCAATFLPPCNVSLPILHCTAIRFDFVPRSWLVIHYHCHHVGWLRCTACITYRFPSRCSDYWIHTFYVTYLYRSVYVTVTFPVTLRSSLSLWVGCLFVAFKLWILRVPVCIFLFHADYTTPLDLFRFTLHILTRYTFAHTHISPSRCPFSRLHISCPLPQLILRFYLLFLITFLITCCYVLPVTHRVPLYTADSPLPPSHVVEFIHTSSRLQIPTFTTDTLLAFFDCTFHICRNVVYPIPDSSLPSPSLPVDSSHCDVRVLHYGSRLYPHRYRPHILRHPTHYVPTFRSVILPTLCVLLWIRLVVLLHIYVHRLLPYILRLPDIPATYHAHVRLLLLHLRLYVYLTSYLHLLFVGLPAVTPTLFVYSLLCLLNSVISHVDCYTPRSVVYCSCYDYVHAFVLVPLLWITLRCGFCFGVYTTHVVLTRFWLAINTDSPYLLDFRSYPAVHGYRLRTHPFLPTHTRFPHNAVRLYRYRFATYHTAPLFLPLQLAFAFTAHLDCVPFCVAVQLPVRDYITTCCVFHHAVHAVRGSLIRLQLFTTP